MHLITRRRTIAMSIPVLLALTARATPALAAAAPEVVELWLVDAGTDTPIVALQDYDTLRLPMLPAQLSIEAVANAETDSVRLEIDHVQSALENFVPYSLRGDTGGDFTPAPELRTPGWVTISAQPYAGPDLTGEAGDEVDLHLYLHQPDFVVRTGMDLPDHDPGDGWCTVGPPPKVIDDLVAVVGPKGLQPWEVLLAESASTRIGGDGAPARADGLAPTIEVDERQSSKELRALAQATNDAAAAQLNAWTTTAEPAKVELPEVTITRRPSSGDWRAAASTTVGWEPGPWIAEIPHPWSDLDLGLVQLVPDTTCTLRAAIEEANALPGRQSILLDSPKGPFTLHHGQLDVTDGVDVIGHGGRAVVDAQGVGRVLFVNGDHIVNLRSLELANGNPTVGDSGARGGALWVREAHVQMSDSVVRDSRANFGGGIYVDGDGRLTLTASALRDNIAGTPDDGISGGGVTQRGGGLFNLEGVVTISNSAVFDNLAVRGGGLSNFGGTLRVENTSVIDNEALALGGGIENFDNAGETGVLHLSFATVAHNAAGTSGAPPADHRVGGGLYNAATAFVASSILAGNTDAHAAGQPLHAPDCHSPTTHAFTSFRHNVVGVLNANCELADVTWGTTAWIDHGTENAPLDPGLTGKLAWDHRHYRMITTSSPAVDAAATQSASLYPCPDTDSRDRVRPVGDGCDVGAVERQ